MGRISSGGLRFWVPQFCNKRESFTLLSARAALVDQIYVLSNKGTNIESRLPVFGAPIP